MTIERAKELLPLIQAFAEGKTIQGKVLDVHWHDIPDPTWDNDVEYRVKPEPRQFWMVDGPAAQCHVFPTLEQAKEFAAKIENRFFCSSDIIRLQEVES